MEGVAQPPLTGAVARRQAGRRSAARGKGARGSETGAGARKKGREINRLDAADPGQLEAPKAGM